MARYEVIDGDLLTEQVDAIVNPWNRNVLPRWMVGASGVSGALKKVTGPGPWEELHQRGHLEIGEATLTGSGDMPNTPWLIHVAGLNLAWRATETSVTASIRNAIKLAHERHFQTIATPLIGSGSGGMPAARSLDLITTSIQDCPEPVTVRIIRRTA